MPLEQTSIDAPDGWKERPFWKLKYIDDGRGGEVVCNVNAPSHITHRKEVKLAHAAKSEHFLNLMAQNAAKIGMKINTSKTKLLCINVAQNSMVNTYINASKGERINGLETLKCLGLCLAVAQMHKRM